MDNSWTKEDVIKHQVHHGGFVRWLLYKLKILQIAIDEPEIYCPGMKSPIPMCGVYRVWWYEIKKGK